MLEKEIQQLKERHAIDLEHEEKKKQMSMYQLEQKRSNMSALYDAEIEQYLSVISGKDRRIGYLLTTIRKALKMMEHPRLMQLITRELNYDRFEYTYE